MLDDITKKKINSLRDILVGKLPDPKAQIEQITNGLIYKFMNDMDDQSVSLGGKATYFSGKYQKYSWKNLTDSKTSGVEKVNLYSEALEKMENNENLPELFRDIFKNSFIPFKDPSTLNMFLKEINEFHYSHSEKLGDAFEYLLSFMGSQGDAGQFRTPRHIIDFVVSIINPKKSESILDPACGTAGFLISSYKNILKQNTKKSLGDALSASDRKKIGENLNGYDISPDMVKMSLVNMYLHKFSNPKISEYDTLSNENKWNEYYDVILANPPFFSPKGGITPHKRFGVKSTKAEVLFVDYINQHLKPNGRAGIIVPEGILFNNAGHYKLLRKSLIEKSLLGIVSFPGGVFQPYSSVKTSLLILDKKENKNQSKIFFGIAKSDGFTLTSSRKKNENNDLDKILIDISEFYLKKKIKENENFLLVNKEEVLGNNDVSLLYSTYRQEEIIEGKFPYFKLNELIEESKVRYSGEDRNIWSVSNKKGFVEPKEIFSHEIASDDIKNYKKVDKDFYAYNPSRVNVGSIALNESDKIGFVSPMYVVFKNLNKEKLNNNYLFALLKSKIGISKIIQNSIGTVRNSLKFQSLGNISIPLPSISIQDKLVKELEEYKKIIDGCRQVIENFDPKIEIDPNWEMVELENEIDFVSGVTIQVNNSLKENGLPIITMADITEDGFINTKKIRKIDLGNKKYNLLKKGDLLFNWRNGSLKLVGKTAYFDLEGDYIFASFSQGLRVKKNILSKYLWIILNQFRREGVYLNFMRQSINGLFNREEIKKLKIPLPNKEIQNKIISEIDEQFKLIKSNHKIIEIFEKKIDDKINKIWSN